MKQKLNDEIIIQALLSYPTIKQASQALDRCERSIYLRLKDPEFKERLEEERRAILEAQVRAIQSKVSDAIQIIHSIAMNEELPAQTRLNACNSIISNSIKMTETVDIITRLARLEEMQGEMYERN